MNGMYVFVAMYSIQTKCDTITWIPLIFGGKYLIENIFTYYSWPENLSDQTIDSI